MNVVVLKGNLTRDPVSRTVTVSGKSVTVANLSLAVNRHYKAADGTKGQEVLFIECEAWDSGAETIVKHLHKGDPLLVKGSLKLDSWEKDGVKQSKIKVRVDSFEFIGQKQANGVPGKDVGDDTDAVATPSYADSDPGMADDIPF